MCFCGHIDSFNKDSISLPDIFHFFNYVISTCITFLFSRITWTVLVLFVAITVSRYILHVLSSFQRLPLIGFC